MPDSVKREFTPVGFKNVQITDNFWSPRIKINREVTIPHEYKQCKDTGRILGFVPDWVPQNPGESRHIFNDSDVAKWVEAASYSLATHPDPELDALLDEVIELIAKAQQPDGYLNTYFSFCAPDKRWTNLRDCHELYCAGHLIEAAVAHYEATGKRRLLDVMCKYADYIDSVFGPEPGKKRGYCGHQEIELALVKLYRVTGNERYLKLSKFFIDERGRQPHYYDLEARERGEDPANFWAKSYEYCQAHIPVREQTEVVGHAVRAFYMYSAMADLAGEYGDESLLRACERLWDNGVNKRMYITGGIGPSAKNEGFTFDYDLPNETAYAETCAAIALLLFAHRMLQLDCDSRYGDIVERTLYNGILSGVSLDGTRFFYQNPLASLGTHHRSEWFGCACCPPNIARLLASLGGYIYACSDTDAAINLYIQSSASVQVAGQNVIISQKTNYPWDGNITITVKPEKTAQFAIRLRIPSWCRSAELSVNGQRVDVESITIKGFARIEREWSSGDVIELELPMPIERMSAHPDVRQDIACVALQRGPIVFCIEQADNEEPIHRIVLPDTSKLEAELEKDLLGGVVAIKGEALALDTNGWDGVLYRPSKPSVKTTKIKAIPYYAWDNREPGEMSVWIRAIPGV